MAQFPEYEEWNNSFNRWTKDYLDNSIAAQAATAEGNQGNFSMCNF
jgi:hypothetical protein